MNRGNCQRARIWPSRSPYTCHQTHVCPLWQDILLHLLWVHRTQQHAAPVLLEGRSPSDWRGRWMTAHVVIQPPVQSRTPSQCFLSSLIHLSSLKYLLQPHPRAWNYGNSPVMELLVINQYSWPQRWTHNINYYNSCASLEEEVCGRGQRWQSSQSLRFLWGWLRLALRRKWAGRAWMAEEWGLRWWGKPLSHCSLSKTPRFPRITDAALTYLTV